MPSSGSAWLLVLYFVFCFKIQKIQHAFWPKYFKYIVQSIFSIAATVFCGVKLSMEYHAEAKTSISKTFSREFTALHAEQGMSHSEWPMTNGSPGPSPHTSASLRQIYRLPGTVFGHCICTHTFNFKLLHNCTCKQTAHTGTCKFRILIYYHCHNRPI